MIIVALTLAGLLWSAATGCVTNPATGKTNFNFFASTESELDIANQAAPEFKKAYGGQIPSTPIQNYVSDLGHRLAAQSERPELPWEFTVVDSPVINAFALPAGKIFITRGLLSKFDNEAQLAGVLGHEIGHVTAQHVGQQMSQAYTITGLGIVLGIAGEVADEDWLKILGAGTSLGGGVYLLSYGRSQENQADELGLRYMTRLGYNPVGHIQVMELFAREAAAAGGNQQIEFLSTHPHPESRIERLTKIISKQYPDYQNTTTYKFDPESYQTNILKPLANLPAPKHNPAQQSQ